MVTFNVKARIDFYINKLNQTSGQQNLTPVFLWSCNLSQLSGMSRLWTPGHGFVVGDHGVLVNAIPAFGDRGKIDFNKLQTKKTCVKTWKRLSWEEAGSYSLTTIQKPLQEVRQKDFQMTITISWSKNLWKSVGRPEKSSAFEMFQGSHRTRRTRQVLVSRKSAWDKKWKPLGYKNIYELWLLLSVLTMLCLVLMMHRAKTLGSFLECLTMYLTQVQMFPSDLDCPWALQQH